MIILPYKHKTQFYETDQMGIIHHSNYIKWFEEARIDFMEQIGFGYHKAIEAGIDFAVLGVSCEYKSMVRFGETVQIHAYISEITPARMTVQYQVFGADSETLYTTGETRHCYVRSRDKRPVSLKKELPELYGLFAEICKD